MHGRKWQRKQKELSNSVKNNEIFQPALRREDEDKGKYWNGRR